MNSKIIFELLLLFVERNVIILGLDKILQGKTVRHRKLGSRVIDEISDSYIVVRFEKDDKVSRFIYPDAFEHFLSLEDTDARSVVDKHLHMKKIIMAEQERRRKHELKKLDDELKLRHKEEMLKRQKVAMAKAARAKRLTDKRKMPV